MPHGAAVPLDASTKFGRWTVAATRVDAVEDENCDLESFVATGRFAYHVQCSTLTLAPRQGLRKCRPLQRLDGLTKSPRLRDVVPVPVGKPGDEWVRVTVSFNVMYLYSQTRRIRENSAASRASRCRRAPRRPGRRRGLASSRRRPPSHRDSSAARPISGDLEALPRRAGPTRRRTSRLRSL